MKKEIEQATYACLILLFFLAPTTLPAQELPTLVPKSVTLLTGPLAGMGPLVEPSRCDESGNIYVRVVRSERSVFAPITRISPDGEKTTTFGIDAITDPPLDKGTLMDFTVDLRGHVYALAFLSKTNESYVVRFHDDGQFDSAVKLDSMAFPTTLAVFPSGEFLVTGMIPGPEGIKDGKPFTGIFDWSGKLLANVSLPGDVTLGKPSSAGPEQPEQEKQTRAATERFDAQASPDLPISGGVVDMGDDGNAYLMRAAQPPLVYVISPSGGVLHQWHLKAPSGGLFPTEMKVSSGRIALTFEENSLETEGRPQLLYSIYDAMSGDHLVDYVAAPRAAGSLARYSPNQFTFIGRDKEHPPAIVAAVPQ